MENILGSQTESEIMVFVILSRLHHYIYLILHKIASWDNV